MNSKILPKIFKAKCNEVFSSRKNAARNHYFKELGYSSIFAKKEEELDKVLEAARCRETKEGRAKMWNVNSSELQDTSWCKRTTFFDIFQNGFGIDCSGEAGRPRIEGLFWSDISRRAF